VTGFQILQQADFSRGMFRNPSPELIPSNGFQDAVNALLEEDGSIFRRGGSTIKSGADAAAPITMLWDGYTAAGPRTAFAYGGASQALCTLAANDITPLIVAGSKGSQGGRPATGIGCMFYPQGDGTATISIWGGARAMPGSYSTGTITTALLSRTVTGAGTGWNSGVNIEPGALIFSGGNMVGVVASVDSATQLTLHDFATAALTGAAYNAWPTFLMVPATIANLTSLTEPLWVGTVGDPARLLVGYKNRVQFSAPSQPTVFAATDYHQLPEGAVIGLSAIQDQAFVFTTAGVWTISNMNFNLVDVYGNVQQRLSQLTKDVILLDARGIAGWRNQLIVPGIDDIWLMGPAQYPLAISDPIRSLYRSYVRSGYLCGGGTVYRNHFIMPIVDATNAWVDTLVYRLDQGGWTRFSGHAGTSVWFDNRAQALTRRPSLLSANGLRIVDLSQCWTPSGTVKNDGDGSTHTFSVTTRDYASGRASNRNLVKKVRCRYELIDAASDNPVLKAYFGTGVLAGTATWGAATWGSFYWNDASGNAGFVQLAGSASGGDAPVDSGVNPFPWLVGQQAPAFFRLRFILTNPAARLTIREIDSFVRARGRQ